MAEAGRAQTGIGLLRDVSNNSTHSLRDMYQQ